MAAMSDVDRPSGLARPSAARSESGRPSPRVDPGDRRIMQPSLVHPRPDVRHGGPRASWSSPVLAAELLGTIKSVDDRQRRSHRHADARRRRRLDEDADGPSAVRRSTASRRSSRHAEGDGESRSSTHEVGSTPGVQRRRSPTSGGSASASVDPSKKRASRRTDDQKHGPCVAVDLGIRSTSETPRRPTAGIRTRESGRRGGFRLDVGRRRRDTVSAITIRCASYPEWLRDGPCDATATGPPSRRMLVLTPAQRRVRAGRLRRACRWDR